MYSSFRRFSMCKKLLNLSEVQEIHDKLKTTKDKKIFKLLTEKNYVDKEDGVELPDFGLSFSSYYIESAILFEPKMIYKDISAYIKDSKDGNQLEILWNKGVGLDTPTAREFEKMSPKLGSRVQWSEPKQTPKEVLKLMDNISKDVGVTGYIHIYMVNDTPVVAVKKMDKWVKPLNVNSDSYVENIITCLLNSFNDINIKDVYWQDCGNGVYITRKHRDNECTISIY